MAVARITQVRRGETVRVRSARNLASCSAVAGT